MAKLNAKGAGGCVARPSMDFVLTEPQPGSVAQSVRVAELPTVAFDEPGGPQATELELREQLSKWVLDQHHPSGREAAKLLLEGRGDEMLAALMAAHAGDSSQALEQLRSTFRDINYAVLDDLPPRRALEAALSFHHAISEQEGKARFAHLSWNELRDLAAEHQLTELAGKCEYAYVMQRARTGNGLFTERKLPDEIREWLDSEAGIGKVGPGRRSGRIEDYSRKELAEMLGYQNDEVKPLSDEDLRNMALAEGALPPMQGMPSHVQMAWQLAENRAGSRAPHQRVKDFQRYMRMPYSRLAFKTSCGVKPGERRPTSDVISQLSERYPLLTSGDAQNSALICTNSTAAMMAKLDETHGVKLAWSSSEVNHPNPDARQEYISPIELMHGDALNDFVAEQGGGRFNGIYGHGGMGRGWSQSTHSPTGQRSIGVGVLGFYSPTSGQIHINPDMETKLRKARRGKATPEEVSAVTSTITHELLHACSGDLKQRVASRQPLGTPGSVRHTIEEGTVSTLESWHAHKLATKMGVWKEEDGILPSSSHYPYQREVMCSLASLAAGTLEPKNVREGQMSDPRSISRDAFETMSEAHSKHGANATEFYVNTISERYGLSEKQATEVVRDIVSAVPFQGRGRMRWSSSEAESVRDQIAAAAEKVISTVPGPASH